MVQESYSSLEEAKKILSNLLESDTSPSIPPQAAKISADVRFIAARDFPYLPIPFKETETIAALKAIEGGIANALASVRYGLSNPPSLTINLEKATAFLFQAYLATVGGHGKLDPQVKQLLKGKRLSINVERFCSISIGTDTDLLKAQSDPYRRMSANLYETKKPGDYYHIHGSLEASATLKMIGLEPFRPDLHDHDAIVNTIEPAVQKFTIDELEETNAANRQAGVPVLKHEDFLKTKHVTSPKSTFFRMRPTDHID
jgi:hypothetical protein